MAIRSVAHTPASPQRVQAKKAKKTTHKLPLHRTQLANQAMRSPYDGTSPLGMGGLAARPLTAMEGGARPQLNATNQSALAPNGDINQTVTNQNHYTNRYYNIITSPMYGYGGGFYGATSGYGMGPWGSSSFVDPQTGVWYTRNEGGVMGWLKRLFRGY